MLIRLSASLGLAGVLAAAVVPAAPALAQVGIGVGVGGVGVGVGFHVAVAPPPLPVYEEPPLPAPGYLFMPGYWNYGDAGYFWVPGTWVQPPAAGLLWTPGYWGWRGGFYGFNAGYWGPHVGFYGGINYGFGYTGAGFFGGEWRGGVFAYNTAFNHFGGVHVTNVYNRTVVVNHVTNVSFNGPGGVVAEPTAQERAFAAEPHMAPTAAQAAHIQAAAANPALRQSVNHGAPAIAAVARPGEFHGPGVVPAHPFLATHPLAAARTYGAEGHPYLATHPYAAAAVAARPAVHPAAAPHPAAAHAAAEKRPR